MHNKVTQDITRVIHFEYSINDNEAQVVIDGEKKNNETLVWVQSSEGGILELTLTEAKLLVNAINQAVSELYKTE